MDNPRNDTTLDELQSKYKELVDKTYLNVLHDLTFSPSHSIIGHITLFKIENLADPVSSHFFTFTLNALAHLKEVFGYILQSVHNTITFYIGLKTTKNMAVSLNILKNGLKNSYPTSQFNQLSQEESSSILKKIFNPKLYEALSSVIVIPNNTSQSNTPINQNLLDLMYGEDFLAFFLASASDCYTAKHLIKELESLYTDLSSFAQATYAFTYSFSKNPSTQLLKSVTENTANSCIISNGTSQQGSTSKGIIITPQATSQAQNIPQLALSIGYSEACSIASTDNKSMSKEDSKGDSITKSTLNISSTFVTNTDSISFIHQNKHVTELLDKINALISRLNSASQDNLFCFGAYFLSPDAATSIRAAYTYSGLAKDNSLNIEDPFITTWEFDNCIFPDLLDELSKFNHLSFFLSPKNDCITTSTPITSSELLNTFYFPHPSSAD